MTKQQELDTLRAAVHALGADSYLGPWLDSIADELQALITSDLQPTLSLAEARAKSADIIAAGETKAAEIVARAEAYAAKTIKAAEDRSERLANALYNTAQNTIRALQA